MRAIKGIPYDKLKKELLGKRAHFISDCEFFPNFDVRGKVIGMKIAQNSEVMMTFLSSNGKTIEIGSNMKNLKYELL